MPTATVTSKGQITIPKTVRELLRVEAGDQVDFSVNERGDVVVRSATADVRELRGLLKRTRRRAVSVEAMNEAVLREHARKR
jgi:AbrB family looped-hinge helix DNA binding protein